MGSGSHLSPGAVHDVPKNFGMQPQMSDIVATTSRRHPKNAPIDVLETAAIMPPSTCPIDANACWISANTPCSRPGRRPIPSTLADARSCKSGREPCAQVRQTTGGLGLFNPIRRAYEQQDSHGPRTNEVNEAPNRQEDVSKRNHLFGSRHEGTLRRGDRPEVATSAE